MKNKLKSVLFFIVLITSISKGQSSYDALISQGVNLSYSFRLEEAEALFSKAIGVAPERPEAYHYTAQIHLWAFLGSKDNSELSIFQKWSGIAVEKAESLLNRNKDDFRINYLLGNIYMLRAMAFSTDNSNIKAFGAGKISYNYFKNTLKLNPSFNDAYRGLGLFHYALDFIPGIFKWAVALTGIEADKEKGFQYVRRAFKWGREDRVESAFHLAKFYTDYTGDYDSAIAILKPVLIRFSENPVFNYQAAVICIKAGDNPEAEKYLNKVISLNHKRVKQMNALALFLKGDTYFKRNDFPNALLFYSSFLENALDVDYTGIASLRLAVSMQISGKKGDYRKVLASAAEGNSDIFEDNFAKRISKMMGGRAFSEEEIMVIKGNNFLENRQYSNALQVLANAPLISSRDLRMHAYIIIAEANINEGKISEALKYLSLTDEITPDENKWLIPKSYYLKALIEYKKGNFSLAREYYRKGISENDSDFKDQIDTMLNNLKYKIFKNK